MPLGRKGMRVQCVDNSMWEEHLTIGKIYEVMDSHIGFLITDDKGETRAYAQSMFKVMKEENGP